MTDLDQEGDDHGAPAAPIARGDESDEARQTGQLIRELFASMPGAEGNTGIFFSPEEMDRADPDRDEDWEVTEDDGLAEEDAPRYLARGASGRTFPVYPLSPTAYASAQAIETWFSHAHALLSENPERRRACLALLREEIDLVPGPFAQGGLGDEGDPFAVLAAVIARRQYRAAFAFIWLLMGAMMHHRLRHPGKGYAAPLLDHGIDRLYSMNYLRMPRRQLVRTRDVILFEANLTIAGMFLARFRHPLPGKTVASKPAAAALPATPTAAGAPEPVATAAYALVSQLPGDVFPITTGVASQAARRGFGGPAFWEGDVHQMLVKTTPFPGQNERIRAIYRPAGEPPAVNWNDAAGAEGQIRSFLQESWADVQALGPDEADWFDLLIAMHIGDGQLWRRRDRNDPRTWTQVPVDALKRIRERGPYKGFRSTTERLEHQEALGRVLRMQLQWETDRLKQRGNPTEILPYWHYTERGAQLTFDGPRMVERYLVYPTWWFDVEMGACDGWVGHYFEAGLRAVLQIPPNKAIAKAIARYLVCGFWRMASTKGRGYGITLADLHQYAGIEIPEWARVDTSKYALRFGQQLRHITEATGEVALVKMPEIVPPAGRKGTLDRWLSQEIQMRPHPEAAPELVAAVRYLEERGNDRRRKEQAIEVNAEGRLLAAKKRGRGRTDSSA